MAYHHHKATEEIHDGVMNLPSIPKFGMILFPSNPSLQFVWEMFFDDEAECADILEELLSHRNSARPQLPIPHQLALTLERLGSNGNGASVGRFSRNLSVGRGTLIKVSRRVIQAINEVLTNFIAWPNKD
ncbi:uncharacterized protein PGTG_13627 [Puccinia graminis f. sp. tritici CRL 75-36-700-3]|uniref:Uncharacterized protein n=1 Tax=Puccinia graminis f. sp. tritici (strain CRL 75-36-700-3 / race SCCL) TaxID=418459 RepID=E3KT13_PUCGT|nr:uncharacterized protein PGTG_13627 [Puccinia graminis f. sp. tritici CRL 75-36-700-3]EFP87399.1 hypothetical protein PGTG_13627 [Puccinia graminis f. sp. tritici CRL 75-36-700-3]